MYEFECPHCNGINVRNNNNNNKNTVCDFCDGEFNAEGKALENKASKKKNINIEDVKLDFSKMNNYGSGQYLVGNDIVSGEYLFISDSRGIGYIEISEDPNSFTILQNEASVTYDFFVVNDGEFLKINHGKIYNLKECKIDNIGIDFPVVDCGLRYRVGIDIKKGMYKLSSESHGYYEVCDGPLGKNMKIISNDNFTGQCYVSVEDGQYLKLNNGTKLI